MAERTRGGTTATGTRAGRRASSTSSARRRGSGSKPAKRSAATATAKRQASAAGNRAKAATKAAATRTATSVGDGLLGGRTLADPHDGEGHVVLRGVAWAAVAALALAAGPWPFAVLLGGAAAVAAWEVAGASADTDLPADPVLAAVLAAALPPAAYFDSAAAGAVLVSGVVGSAAVAWFTRSEGTPLAALVGANVATWAFIGVAAAGPMFAWRVELGAVVVLLAFVAIYDMGSHLVGVDASSAWEGPVSGVVGVGVVAFATAAIGVPPFELDGAASFALVAAATLPFGPVVASLLVPPEQRSPMLRRIDSLLVIGPVWPLLVGLYVQSL